ncbi:c-type cytochrome [Neptuniibacter sp. QD48_11]|uniref:c-type cytochrome n=1 Tax=unclassified Neptuniibacter TaxID=2630693 RepID=UPI0039F61913
MRSLALSLLCTTALLLSGCDREIPPERMKSGEDLYGYYCKECHTKHGPGAYMEKFAGKEPMEAYKIILMIKYGYNKEKHSMPVFDQLSEKQADAVAQYVVKLQHSHMTAK